MEARQRHIERLREITEDDTGARMDVQLAQYQRTAWYQQLGYRAQALLLASDIEPTEIISGVAAMLFGIVLLMPYDTFDSTPAFALVRLIAIPVPLGGGVTMWRPPEQVWGVLILLISLWQLGAVLWDRYEEGSARCTTAACRQRRNAAMAALVLWLLVDGFFFYANPYGTSIAAYSGLAACALWTWLRLSVRGQRKWSHY